jgi:molybdopterin-binding protein
VGRPLPITSGRSGAQALGASEEYNRFDTAGTNEEDAMKLSARNVLPATVKAVTPGTVDTEVVIELAPGIEVVSIITKKSAENLGLKPGAKAYAIVKASNVIIGVD